mgnify:CR=1 FL=1
MIEKHKTIGNDDKKIDRYLVNEWAIIVFPCQSVSHSVEFIFRMWYFYTKKIKNKNTCHKRNRQVQLLWISYWIGKKTKSHTIIANGNKKRWNWSLLLLISSSHKENTHTHTSIGHNIRLFYKGRNSSEKKFLNFKIKSL